MDGLQPFLPGCFGHSCAQRAVSHQQVGGIGSPFAGLAVAGFTGSAKFQHIAQHGNAAAAGAGLKVAAVAEDYTIEGLTQCVCRQEIKE